MKSHPTYDDVAVILHLYELRREEKLRKARSWFTSSFRARNLEEFNSVCPPGSEEHVYFRMVITYWEMAASFITTDVLNEELFFQSGGEMLVVWEKLKPFIGQYREWRKNPTEFQNLETVANSYLEWMNKHAPEFYPAFRQRVQNMGKDHTRR